MEAAQLAAREINDGPWPETGFGWYDQATGCRVTASTPEAEPELWNQYLDGALESYRKHGLDWVLDLERIRDGADTTLFFAALDPQGRVVGGDAGGGAVAVSGGFARPAGVGRKPGLPLLRYMIANRIPFGVVEVKSAWTNSREYGNRALSTVLARTALPTMTLLGAQFVMATAAAHVLEQWQSSGGVVASRVPAAAYPNENYRTKVMWWDRRTLAAHADPAQFKLMCAENTEILSRLSA